MTPAALKTEITTGPLAAELAAPWASGADSDVSAILNRPDQSGYVPATELRIVLVSLNVLPHLDLIRTHLLLPGAANAAPTVAATYGLFVLASKLQYVLDAGLRADVDELGAGADALISSGLMDAAGKAAVLAKEVKISRVQVAFGLDANVSASDVAAARKAG